MNPTKDILELLFATVATIVATLTGLIGAFSTFRLQNINREVNLLKDLVLNKKFENEQTIKGFLRTDNYGLMVKIYDQTMEGARLLKNTVLDNGFDKHFSELLIDVDNIISNQMLHDQIKALTVNGFKTSLAFVFLSLILLVCTNCLMYSGHLFWVGLIIYLSLVGYVLFLFVKQLEKLID